MKNIVILILLIVCAVSVFAQGKKSDPPKEKDQPDSVQVILIPELVQIKMKEAQAKADQLQRQIDNIKIEVQGMLLGVILSNGLDPANIKMEPKIEEDKITIIKKTP
jgi:hypothetical protein